MKRKPTIYLAARYSRREELLGYKDELEGRGYVITSRWLSGNHQVDGFDPSSEVPEADRVRFAVEDYEDVLAAETVISFTEPPRSTNSRGGRHVEFGIALAAGKEVIVIGPRENVFHCLPKVYHFRDWWTFIVKLDQTYPRDRTAMVIGDELAAKFEE